MLRLLRHLDPTAQMWIGGVIAALGLSWLLYSQYEVFHARDWPSVQGWVVESTSSWHRTRGGGRSYRPSIRYNYEVGGRTYTGARIWLAKDETFGEQAIGRFLSHYPTGGMVTVRYDPADPAQAALLIEGERDLPILVMAIGLIVGGFGYWRRRKALPAAPPASQVIR
jgi:hypothetical protein